MAINAIDAVWIAAAALATKATSRKTTKFDLQDVCFEASTILDLAKQITEEDIDISTVLVTATAHAEGSEANYLVDEHGLRRVSYIGEFSGVKECPLTDVINEGRSFQVIQKLSDTTKTFEFMNRGYTEQFKKGFSTKGKRTVVTEWFVSGDPTRYDVVGAFNELNKVDWKQSTNVAVGDIVYIYVSKGVQAVRYKCKVNKVDLPTPEIDDSKFNLSGEFDGSYGRYMEIELIKELKGDLFSKVALEKHGFASPQSPVRVIPQVKEYLDLVQKLQEAQELDADIHDGSYEMVRETINAYANMGDIDSLDYKDLNLVYLMSVGTWKQKIPAKKKTIADSNLPQTGKDRLADILNKVWSKAENFEYQNEEKGRPSIGMFGTEFFTFLGKTDETSPRNFIKMCIDIKDMTDEQAILERCGETLTDKFRGMKAASASMILHCLKPTVFPIFNSNMGADDIFVYLGAEMKRKTEIYSYIKNVGLVKKLRDDNFSVKNYRIFDTAAWDIGSLKEHTNIDYLSLLEYLENNRGIPYSNPEAPGLDQNEKDRLLTVKAQGQNAVNEMKKMVKLCKKKFGLDKCEPMSWLDGSNTKTRNYLWAQLKKSEYGDNPISISLFVEMSPEMNKARYRFSLEVKNDCTDKAQMQKYHSYFDIPLQAKSSLVFVVGSNDFSSFFTVDETVPEIKKKISDGTYKKVQLCRIKEWDEYSTNDDIEAAMLTAVEELMPFYNHVIGAEENEYWPSLEKYNPGITCEQWQKFILEDVKKYPDTLELLDTMVINGGKATCKFLSEQLGVETSACISRGANFGRRAAKFFEIEEYKNKDGKDTPFVTCFVGRYVENNLYEWKLRDELKEALESNMIRNVREQVKKGKEVLAKYNSRVCYDKNMILYGPPGTGKTYNTIIYAVAICDGKSLSEVESMPYNEVLGRYKELKDKEKRIAFTTFHQSYGYEEFIEGIKPKMDSASKDIEYTIKDGVFKAFCDRAGQKKAAADVQVRDGARVWNVILGGNEHPELKQKCFDEGTIRIGWDEWPEVIDEETENLNDKERRILLNFQEEMEIGDIVVARSTASAVDGVGIICGEAEIDDAVKGYSRKRKVEWIHKGDNIEIIDLNGGTRLDRKSVYELGRINASDVLSRIPDTSKVKVEEETRPYVFIIDEINRGNISKIFGELITLIEPTKRKGASEGMEAMLPYSNKPFGVPNNVYIIGTMNTADRSIALMDTALRRRFQFIEKMPDVNVLRKIGADKVNEAGVELDVAVMLEMINERIEYLFDREHTIGHAFFTGLKDEPTVTKLADIFKKSVIPLLQEYFYEDYSKIMLVLGDNGKEHDGQKFILATETKANTIFRGDTSDIDIPDFSYTIQESAFLDIMSYIEIKG